MSGPQASREKEMLRQMKGMMSEAEAKIKVPKTRAGLEGARDAAKLARQVAELQHENHFLRQYAVKLENQMQIYHAKYPELDVKLSTSESEPMNADLPPWVASAKYMNPLLIAYQRKIDDLTQQNEAYFVEMKDLKERFQKVSNDSKTLSGKDGKVQVRTRVVNTTSNDLVLPSQQAEELREMSQRVQLLRQQVEVLEKQNDSLGEDLSKEREEGELARAQSTQAEATIKHLSDTKRKTEAAIGLLAAEKEAVEARLSDAQGQISTLDSQKSKLKAQVKAKEDEIGRYMKSEVALKETMDKLSTDASEAKREKAQAVAKLGSVEAQLLSEKQTVATCRVQFRENQRRLEAVNKQVALTDQLLREEREASEKQRVELVRQREIAADAELEKDKVLLAERAAREEAGRICAVSSEELARVKKEAAEAQEAMFVAQKQKQNALERKLKDCMLESASNKEAAESNQRQVASLSQQLDALRRIGRENQAKLADEANLAKADARKLGAELLLASESVKRLQKRIDDGEGVWAAQRAKMSAEAQRQREILDQKSIESRTLASEVKMLKEESHSLAVRAESIEKVARQTEGALRDRIEDMESHHKKEMAEMSCRLDEAYKMHEEAERRGESALAEQTQISKKWRRHHESTSTRLRGELDTLQNTLNSLRARNTELEAHCAQVMSDRDQAQLFYSEYEKRCKHLELAVAGLKAKHSRVTTELTASLAREPALVEEVRRLQSNLEKAQADTQKLMTEKNQALRQLELEDQGKAIDLVETLTNFAGKAAEGDSLGEIISSAAARRRREEQGKSGLVSITDLLAAEGKMKLGDEMSLRVSDEEFKEVMRQLDGMDMQMPYSSPSPKAKIMADVGEHA